MIKKNIENTTLIQNKSQLVERIENSMFAQKEIEKKEIIDNLFEEANSEVKEDKIEQISDNEDKNINKIAVEETKEDAQEKLQENMIEKSKIEDKSKAFFNIINKYLASVRNSSDLESALRNSDLEKIFKIQEEAIDYKETTQKAIMHKMLKQKKVSPNTYHQKKQNLEVWVNAEKEKINKQKKDFKNVFQNTIEIINNTNKNKDKIKEILSKSKSKRPGIWSDYSKSRKSFDTSNKSVKDANASMHQNEVKIMSLNSNDHSL